MPVKNPTPELLEAIRENGVCRKTGAFSLWGYRDGEDPKLFILNRGEKLPSGWSDRPVQPKADEPEKPSEPDAE